MTTKIKIVHRQKSIFKRFISFIWLITLFVVTTSVDATGDDAEIAHLCKEGEEVVFSCMTVKKNISFCATPRYTAEKGFMTYRFGRAGQKPELEYPTSHTPVVKAFRVSGLNVEHPKKLATTPSSIYWRQQAAIKFQKNHAITLPDGSYTEIAFQKGAYTYTFFHQITDWIYQGRYDGAGLVVERDGKEPIVLLCNDAQQAVGLKGGDSRFFPRRLGYLIAQVHLKTDFEHEAKAFRGVSPLNRDSSFSVYFKTQGAALSTQKQSALDGEFDSLNLGDKQGLSYYSLTDGSATTHDNYIDNASKATSYSPYQLTQINAGMSLVQGLYGLKHWDQLSDAARVGSLAGLAKYVCSPITDRNPGAKEFRYRQSS